MSKFVKIAVNIAAGLLLLSPFFFLRSLLYPFVLGKATIIQIIAALAFPLLAVFIFKEWRILFKKGQWITFAICAYAATLILAAALGISPWQSFWGTSDRSLGVFTVLHILAAYFIFLAALKEERVRKYLPVLAVLAGLIAAILGIFEYIRTSGSRSMGLFGNPILFANYLLFPLFLALIFLTGGALWKRICSFGVLIAIFIALLFAQSRGALAGAILGGAVVLAFYVFAGAGKKKGRLLKLAGIIGAILILLFVLAKSGNHTVISLTGRFTQISLKDASSSQRLLLYKIALKAAGERPVLGWGPENFDYAFDRNYDPSLLKYGVSETWVDRSHNIYLDTLAMSGILGLASYAAIFAAAFAMLWRSARAGHRRAPEAVVLGALLAAYGAANLFAFDSPPSLIYFMFILAYISAAEFKQENEKQPKADKVYIILIIGFLIALASFIFTIRNARGAFHMLRFSALPPPAVTERLEEIDSVIKINPPLLRDFRLRFGNVAFEDAGALPKEEARVLLDRAIEEMEKNIKDAPEDFSYRFALGNLYLERGILIDSADWERAEGAFLSAEPLSPARQALYFQLASVEFLKRDFKKAISILEKTVDFDPDLGQSHWRLGIAYAYNEELDKAFAEWRKALYSEGAEPDYFIVDGTGANKKGADIINLNYSPSVLKEVQYAFNLALREKEYKLLRTLVTILINLEGGSADRFGQLAVVELNLGNYEAAREAVKAVIALFPESSAEAGEFLKQIDAVEKAAR